MAGLINDALATRIRQPATLAWQTDDIDWLIALTYLERRDRAPQRSATRMDRILSREQRRHGERIHPDGDMYQQHVDFLEWAGSYDHATAPVRSLDLHEQWMQQLKCPILKLNSDLPVNELCNAVLKNAGL